MIFYWFILLLATSGQEHEGVTHSVILEESYTAIPRYISAFSSYSPSCLVLAKVVSTWRSAR